MSALAYGSGALVLAATTVASAANLALLQASESGLRNAFLERGRERNAEWIVLNLANLENAVALFRTFGRLGFFAIVLMGIAPADPDSGSSGAIAVSALTLPRVLIALFASCVLVWLFTSVIAASMAKWAAEGMIVTLAPVLRLCHWMARPLTVFSQPIDEAMRRLIGVKDARDLAEEALLDTIADTHHSGGIDKISSRILGNVVHFSGLPVSAVMTPRTEVEGLEYTDDFALIREVIVRAGHSRIPVYRGSLDQVVGVLYLRDLAIYLGEEPKSFSLAALLRQPIRVPRTKAVQELLGEFQRSEVHMAIVVDEFGGTAGLATIEDVLEEIVGEIHDEHEPPHEEPPKATLHTDGSWIVDGAYRIDAFAKDSNLDLPEDSGADTVAGLILAFLGRVPRHGESMAMHGAEWHIVAATSTRIEIVRVQANRRY